MSSPPKQCPLFVLSFFFFWSTFSFILLVSQFLVYTKRNEKLLHNLIGDFFNIYPFRGFYSLGLSKTPLIVRKQKLKIFKVKLLCLKFFQIKVWHCHDLHRRGSGRMILSTGSGMQHGVRNQTSGDCTEEARIWAIKLCGWSLLGRHQDSGMYV